MILTDPIPATDSYEYLCIHDLRCEPHEDDTHSPACHRINDTERTHFYRELLVEHVATRATLLANSAGLVMLDWQREHMIELWREHFVGREPQVYLATSSPRRSGRPTVGGWHGGPGTLDEAACFFEWNA